MQCAVIEFSRNVLGLSDAHTAEIDPESTNPVISMMEAQKKNSHLGGTMRLGSYACQLKPGTKIAQAYQVDLINERHRHRYELNNDYIDVLQKGGMIGSGKNPETGLVESIEIPNHPWFIGVQFHPEYKSTVDNPHPLFVAFVEASLKFKN
jgi:CTP synthase